MEPVPHLRLAGGGHAAIALALTLTAACWQVWGQVPAAQTAAVDRAAALIQARAFDGAADVLRDVLAADPQNRRAKELLAYALESSGDIEGELRVRSDLATEFPDDARAQADYGRVLERSGEQTKALAAYRRARILDPDRPDAELDAAIERMEGKTAVEVGVPVMHQSDPEATATRAQVGAAMPFGTLHHVAFLAARSTAHGTTSASTTTSDVLAASVVLRHRSGAAMTIGPRLHAVSPQGDAPKDVALGGSVAGHAPVGSVLEAEASAEFRTPWEEAAVAVLHGGRTSGAHGRLYAHFFGRRLLLEAGARRRRLSILAADPDAMRRSTATQSLYDAGADVLLWRKPAAGVRGEMLDDALTAPAMLTSAITLSYRHYEVFTRTTPEFGSIIGLVPRGSVDEASVNTVLTSPRGRLGLDLRAGLGRDSQRQARMWRAGGSVIWAPTVAVRLTLDYEQAADAATGFLGRRNTGWVSIHVDF